MTDTQGCSSCTAGRARGPYYVCSLPHMSATQPRLHPETGAVIVNAMSIHYPPDYRCSHYDPAPTGQEV